MINPYKLKKTDLLTFFMKRCRHSHKYCEHPNCFIEEQQFNPKMGFLDIETYGLKGSFHIMLSYAIKTANKNKIYTSVITKKELKSDTFDLKLAQRCINDMLKFDKLVTYYGTWFDLPFIRTRALKWNLNEFPVYGLVQHVDVYYIVKTKLNMHRRSLEAVARHLGISGKTHVSGELWTKAAIHGDEKALGYINDHNKKDVIVLEKVYNKLKHYSKETKKSI